MQGYLYAVDLIPNLQPARVKIGYTIRPVQALLVRARAFCPTAELLGSWPALAMVEGVVCREVRGRIGTSGVFLCDNLPHLLASLSATCTSARPRDATGVLGLALVGNPGPVLSADLYVALGLAPGGVSRPERLEVGAAMRRLGWEHHQWGLGGKIVTGYRRRAR